jgi:hypothetical protein
MWKVVYGDLKFLSRVNSRSHTYTHMHTDILQIFGGKLTTSSMESCVKLRNCFYLNARKFLLGHKLLGNEECPLLDAEQPVIKLGGKLFRKCTKKMKDKSFQSQFSKRNEPGVDGRDGKKDFLFVEGKLFSKLRLVFLGIHIYIYIGEGT